MSWNENVARWVSCFETWDYSERNFDRLQEWGAKTPKLLRLGFHPKLARIQKAEVQDIDVLFYGALGARRRQVIEGLKARNCNVKAVFGVYAAERDALISRAKLVLNLHHYQSQIFEIVRVFYLMSNAKAVVSEVGENTSIDGCYLKGVFPAAYDSLVDACVDMVSDDSRRKALEAKSLESIRMLPQREFMRQVLA